MVIRSSADSKIRTTLYIRIRNNNTGEYFSISFVQCLKLTGQIYFTDLKIITTLYSIIISIINSTTGK